MLWPRVDQKTCLKSITAAGFEVVPIPMLRAPGADELTTDVAAIQQQLEALGADQVQTYWLCNKGWDAALCLASRCSAAVCAGWVQSLFVDRARTPWLWQQAQATYHICPTVLVVSGPHQSRYFALQVACVVTTTSCFAPRAADDVVAVAKLCQAAGVAHIINNAYGVQVRPGPGWVARRL